MSDLLSHQEYQALAADITLPTSAFIDGSFQSEQDSATFSSINPATGKVIAEISECSEQAVAHAVAKARDAFNDGRWSGLAPAARKQAMIQFAKLIKRNSRELAVLESLESGKAISDVVAVDIPEAIECLIWHAEAVDKIYDQIAPSSEDTVALITREPLGVVACVLPWNFPILMMAWKIAPALAAGNCVIVKPAEETSMSALYLAELASRAGLPRGVLNVLPGRGEVTGAALGLHPDIDMVSFTGSTAVGKLFLKYSADSNLKKVVLECGGKNPCVVLQDAGNLDVVAQHVCNAAMWNMGQNCSAGSRLIVHADVAEALLAKIDHRLKEWKTGDPLNPHNQLGAIVSEAHFKRIMAYIESGKKEGATLHCGGEALQQGNGWFIAPTIFTNVTQDMQIAREEIFGPVLCITVVQSYAEAIQVANDTEYGLAASVFTQNLSLAHRAAKQIRAGTVTVNSYGEGSIATPFGGFKQSGFGGRDNSLHAHDQFTELKTIWLDISDQAVDALD